MRNHKQHIGYMNEDQIERRAERIMDSYDRALMRGDISQADYDQMVRDLDTWVDEHVSNLQG